MKLPVSTDFVNSREYRLIWKRKMEEWGMFCPNEGEIHLHVGLRKQPSKMAEIILHEIRHAAEYEWNLEVVEGEAFVTELARIDVALIRANKRLWRWLIATI